MRPPSLGLALLLALSLWPAWTRAQPPGPSFEEPAQRWLQGPPEWIPDIRPFAYVESSYVLNVTGAGRAGTNELRLYDYDEGFNAAAFSLKRDPSERHPFGFGLTLTAGIGSQKNHSLGIFRGGNDQFPSAIPPSSTCSRHMSARVCPWAPA